MGTIREKGDAQGEVCAHSKLAYVQTFPALIDKYLTYLLSGNKVPAFVVFGVAAFVFVEDNRAGNLENVRDLLWTLVKCTSFVALYLVYRFTSRIFRNVGQERGGV